MIHQLFLLFSLNGFMATLSRQTDSLVSKKLDEVVVTATRNERQLGSLPMPVSIIGQKQIQQMGALRLTEVLAEQTGLFIVNDHGQGVQVQGFAPDYTLILVDGEPIIGRTAGTLELSRLAVGNIKQIEIVKGPSSSLYGSEALAGVINIITEKANRTNGSLSARYGTNQTADFSGNLNYRKDKLGITLFGNRYSTGGYTFTPETFGATVTPFQNYTLNAKITYDFSEKANFSLSGRYFSENQDQAYLVDSDKISGKGKVEDWNLNPIFRYRFSKNLKTTFRFYSSQYSTKSTLFYEKNAQVYDESFFTQTFNRPEVQVDYTINAKNTITSGIGRIWETVTATRYDDTKHFETNYVFFQYEFLPINKLTMILGGRYDAHSAYSSQFSPKLSMAYELSPKITLRGAAGVGFKAPDFRQLYLNFANPVVGYSVFGSQEVAAQVAKLQAQGQIRDVLMDLSQFGNIRPENSIAYNLGVKITPNEQTKISVNAFRNDIKDLIETQVVAQKTNGQAVYSYQNLNRVFTQGVEIESSYQVPMSAGQLTISGGYQYLEAKDKDVVDQLNRGEIYRRDPITLVTTRLKSSDYGGLFGRSKHSANVKFLYENSGWAASLRGIYRGRYGFADKNSNAILDADNEYVNGYVLWNIAVTKSIKNWLTLQAGVDDIFNYRNTAFIPSLPGRLIWMSAKIQFAKK